MRAFWLLAPLLLFGCSDDPSDTLPPGGAGDEIALDRIQAEQLKALCSSLFRCEAHDKITTAIKALAQDEAGCRALLAASADDDLGDLRRAVAAGTVKYDGKAAKRCVAAYASSCEIIVRGPPQSPSCLAVFTGTFALGAPCDRGEECEGDAYCARSTTSTTAACPGSCRARIPLGGTCTSQGQCSLAGATGEVICSDGATRTCIDAVPMVVGEGATCGFAPSGLETRCSDGLYCDGLMDQCAARFATGAPCTSFGECAEPGMICRRSPQAEERTCGPFTIGRVVGATCDNESLVCSPQLECGPSGTCIASPNVAGAEGNLCQGDIFSPQCNANLYCAVRDENSSTCQPKVAIGQACDRNAACIDGYCVDGRCRARDCQAR